MQYYFQGSSIIFFFFIYQQSDTNDDVNTPVPAQTNEADSDVQVQDNNQPEIPSEETTTFNTTAPVGPEEILSKVKSDKSFHSMSTSSSLSTTRNKDIEVLNFISDEECDKVVVCKLQLCS